MGRVLFAAFQSPITQKIYTDNIVFEYLWYSENYMKLTLAKVSLLSSNVHHEMNLYSAERPDWVESNLVYDHTSDYQNWMARMQESDLQTSMITDRLCKILFPIIFLCLIKTMTKFKKQTSHWWNVFINKKENVNTKLHKIHNNSTCTRCYI